MFSRRFSALLIALTVLLAAQAWRGQCQTPSQEKMPLRLLYAGHPGSAREADFVGFLKQYFRQVDTGDLAKFNGSQAADVDVVLLDYDGDGFKAPRPNLPANYSRATVTIGVIGAFICDQRSLKTGYM